MGPLGSRARWWLWGACGRHSPVPQAQRHISDLYEDLRDGHNLISLLEVLSGESLVRVPTCLPRLDPLPSFLQAFPTSPFCLAQAGASLVLWSSVRPRPLLWAPGPAAFLPETPIQ